MVGTAIAVPTFYLLGLFCDGSSITAWDVRTEHACSNWKRQGKEVINLSEKIFENFSKI